VCSRLSALSYTFRRCASRYAGFCARLGASRRAVPTSSCDSPQYPARENIRILLLAEQRERTVFTFQSRTPALRRITIVLSADITGEGFETGERQGSA
jgi:hypothetical protein